MKKIRIFIVQSFINFLESIFFYKKLQRFYSVRLSSTPIILDVGANKGQSIHFFKKLRPDSIIHAFEANPSLASKLVRLENVFSNIKIIPKGVSCVEGKKEFNLNVMDETSSFEGLNYDSKYLEKKAFILGVDKKSLIEKSIEVEVITLGDYLDREGIEKVDLIKIDTEGHELKCLQGLFMKLRDNIIRVERIQFEYHDDDMYLNGDGIKAVFDLLIKNRFEEELAVKHPFGKIFEYVFLNRG